MDILTALHEASPTRGKARCKLQRILDDIPDEAPGKAELLAAVEDAANYPAQRFTLTFTALGTPVSRDGISDHRGKRCRCYR
jgi:hypothetical protein